MVPMSPYISLLVLPDRTYPAEHSFLEDVIAKRLATYGHSVWWIQFSGSSTFWLKRTAWNGLPVCVLPTLARFGLPGKLLSRLCGMGLLFGRRSKLLPASLDVILVRNDIMFLAFALYAARRSNAKVVFQLSHLKEEELLERSEFAISQWRVIGRRAVAWLSLKLRTMLMRRCDVVMPISDAMARRVAEKLSPTTLVLPFPLGVDPEIFYPRSGPTRPGVITFVYIGTLSSVRRLNVVIDAFALTRSRFPAVKLLIAGSSPFLEDVASLKDHVRKCGVSSAVEFLGQLPRNRMGTILAQADVALCAIPSDGILTTISPTKLMEYMAAALPVIATWGIDEQERLVLDADAGLLTDFDSAAISTAMLAYATDSNLRRKHGRNGRAYILESRNYNSMARDLERFLVNLVGRSEQKTYPER